MNVQEAQKELRELRVTDNARRIASKIEQMENEFKQGSKHLKLLEEEIYKLKQINPEDDAAVSSTFADSYNGGGRDPRSGYEKFFAPQRNNQ